MICLVLTFALLAATITSVHASDQSGDLGATAERITAIELVDCTGKTHRPFDDEQTKAVALIFVSTDCPIANAFQPTLQSLNERYSKRGIASFLIYSSTTASNEQVAKHATDYKIQMPTIPDSEQRIARLAIATVTPEVVVFDTRGHVQYRGQINNLYMGYGKKRPTATQHFLRDAFDAMLNGETITTPKTKPLGCFIHFEETKSTTSPK